ncbi:HTH domain-containing protein [bacterium]|nr:HTH domain-containing protein [bacterium]
MGEIRHMWRKEEIQQLIKDFKNDLSYQELAGKYGLSIATIRSKLYEIRKQGLVPKRK